MHSVQRVRAPAASDPAPSQVTQEELEIEMKRFGSTSNVWVARQPAGFAFVVRPLSLHPHPPHPRCPHIDSLRLPWMPSSSSALATAP